MALLLDTTAAETVKERFDTAREQLVRQAKRGRRLAAQARNVVEDGADAAALLVRRRPLSAVAGAALVGAALGAALAIVTTRAVKRGRWF